MSVLKYCYILLISELRFQRISYSNKVAYINESSNETTS